MFNLNASHENINNELHIKRKIKFLFAEWKLLSIIVVILAYWSEDAH